MNLKKKKKLIARTLNVGVGRIILAGGEEIKEAITRQDIIDLKKQGIIKIREIRGRRKKVKRKTRRRAGSIKKEVKDRKSGIRIIRKLRAHLKKFKGKISSEKQESLRGKIKTKGFDFALLKEALK